MLAGRLRLKLYLAALAIAFLLHLVVNGLGQGLYFWAVAGISLICLAFVAFKAFSSPPPIAGLPLAVTALAFFAILMPLSLRLAGQPGAMAAGIGLAVVWPQMLVAVFASRLLNVDTQLGGLNNKPGVPVQAQSFPAALVLGAFLTLVFYWLMPQHLLPADPALKVLAAALKGATTLHLAIIYLFFVIVAGIWDSFVLYWNDRAVLRAFSHATGPAAHPSARLHAVVERRSSGRRAAGWLSGAIDRASGTANPHESLAASATEQVYLASRRFLRALVPLLPLLGFLGTVVGLTTALGELPQGLAASSSPDISASLSGLAIKFETTLLGLLGSMIAIAALNILEKKEAELKSACAMAGERAIRGSEQSE